MCSHVKPQNFSVRHCSSSWLILTSFLCIRIILLTPSTTFMRIHKNKTVPIITSHNTLTYKLIHTFETHTRTQMIRCLSFFFFQTPEQKLKYIYFISTQDDERQLEYGELNHGEKREEKWKTSRRHLTPVDIWPL